MERLWRPRSVSTLLPNRHISDHIGRLKRLNVARNMEDYGEPEASRYRSQTFVYHIGRLKRLNITRSVERLWRPRSVSIPLPNLRISDHIGRLKRLNITRNIGDYGEPEASQHRSKDKTSGDVVTNTVHRSVRHLLRRDASFISVNINSWVEELGKPAKLPSRNRVRTLAIILLSFLRTGSGIETRIGL